MIGNLAEAGQVVHVLLEEVTNLVEEPHAILGHFDPGYLELPGEVLVTVMRKHQRYFPLRAGSGDLLPAFITVANGPCDDDVVRAGNESVLRARSVMFGLRTLSRLPNRCHTWGPQCDRMFL